MIGMILRRGAGLMRHTSRVPRPTAAAGMSQRFTFAFVDALRRDSQAKRRQAVADYIDGWAGAVIEAERVDRHTMRCHVTFATRRPVPVKVAEQFIRDCPHYARGSFAACGEAGGN